MPTISAPLIILDFILLSLIVLIIILSRPKHRGWYLASAFIISLNILYLTQLVSPHILGTDVHQEKYMIDQTIALGRWVASNPATTLNTLLSITVTPAIYHQVLNISSESFLKYITPLVYSFVPLILFLIYERIFRGLGKVRRVFSENRMLFSFLSTLVYVFNFAFFMGPGNSRMIPSFLGIALAIYALINEDMPVFARRLIFMLASFLVFVSHYTSSAFWIFTIICVLVIVIPYSKYVAKKTTDIFTLNSVILQIVLYVFWYFFATYAFSKSLLTVPASVIGSFSSFFRPSAYSAEMVETVVGYGLEPGLPTLIMKIAGNIIRTAIPLGWLATVFYMIKNKVLTDWELYTYFMLSIFSFVIIIMSFLPMLTIYYDIQRIYIQNLLVLSLFFPAGIYFISSALAGLYKKTAAGSKFIVNISIWLASFILILHFMCQNGTVFHIAGDNRLIFFAEPLEHNHITLDQEIATAQWIAENRGSLPVAYSGYRGLKSYGHLFWETEISSLKDFNFGLMSIGRFYLAQVKPDKRAEIELLDNIYDAGLTKVYYLH